MSRYYALAMTRPHQKFGFKMPIARQIPRGAMGWGLLMGALTVVMACLYVYQVTTAAPLSDRLQQMNKKVADLQQQITVQEDQVAKGYSMHELTQRAQGLGYVEVKNPSYINPATGVALRR
ncbi:MAG: hypothetical protein WCW31_05235 [Patescibacteria group bacterium]